MRPRKLYGDAHYQACPDKRWSCTHWPSARGLPLRAGLSAAAAAQLASASGEAQLLEAAKQGLGTELERIKGENRDLLQKAALLDSLTAEAEALRHQVCPASTHVG